MKSSSSIKFALGLSLACGALASCATDTVGVDVLEVASPGAASSGALAAIAISSATDLGEIEIHLNGSAIVDLEGDEILGLASTGTLAFAIEPGSYVVEFVDASGQVVLQTAPLEFAAEAVNQVLAYDAGGGLGYVATSENWHAPAEGMVRAQFTNVTARKLSGRLELCTPGAPSDCELLVDDLAHGDAWSGEAPLGTRFEFTPAGDHGPVEFWSAEFGQGMSTTVARVQSYAPIDWVNFDDAECPGCTSSIEVTDEMFRQP